MQREFSRGTSGGLVLFVLCVLVIFSGLVPGEARAYVQDDLDYLNDKGECSVGYLDTPCDLSGANLSGGAFAAADFSGANLSGANLSGANLTNANLTNTNLTSANLSGAKLNGAKLFQVKLTGVNLSGINLPDLNLAGVNLGAADLSNADLSRANLNKTGLRGAKLFGTKLGSADLRGADLREADLRWANLSGADASGANLSGAYLYAANLTAANLTGAVLDNAQLAGAMWTDGVICGNGSIGACTGVFRQADVDRLLSTNQCPNGHLAGANLAGANLAGADLSGADLAGTILSRANLKGAKLISASLEGANLYAADLTQADLGGAILNGADLHEAFLANTNLQRASMYKANLTQAYLPGANLDASNLQEANLSYTNLSKAILTSANMKWAYMPYANLSQANLKHAELDGINLANADLSGTVLEMDGTNGYEGVNLSGARLTGATIVGFLRFWKSNLSGVNFAGLTLDLGLNDSDLRNANLNGIKLASDRTYWGTTDFTGADLTGLSSYGEVLFPGSSLAGTKLAGANLPLADMSGVNLSGADLSGANLGGVNLSGANLWGTDLHGANISGANLQGASLAGANLQGTNLQGTNLQGTNLSNANLQGANLSKTNLKDANLTGANLLRADVTGIDLRGGNVTWATWVDGSSCTWGSIGRCLKSVKPSSSTGTIAFDSLTPELSLPGETASAAKFFAGAVKSAFAAVKSLVTTSPQPLVLKTRYFVLYEGEKPLLAIETTGLSVKVIEGVLHYEGNYQYYVLDVSTTDEVMDAVGPISFTTPAKPLDEDDFGNPLIAQGLKDAQGRNIPLADTKLSTLIAAGKDLLSQQGTLTAIRGAAGAIKDQNSKTLATMNTNVVRVVGSKGGQGAAVIIAASDANLMETIRPLTDSGYSMDKGGNLKPDVTIAPSNISLPLGLFDFSVSIANNTNRTDVVIIPPAPFAADTKWYKVGTDGTLKEYPNFKVDALGNGILTLYDNDEWDKNPAFGIIRDPGGPGVVSTTDSGGKSGCFIATAAYGSYLHPFVNILRTFRDRVLLVSSTGSSFVEWYYRVSPPIADVISRHSVLSAAVRILLLPAIGIAWLSLQVGFIPVALALLFVCALLTLGIRSGRRRPSTPSI
ncbi:MAG: pentapeptide repeat-containing protein [Syntrophales bacterium]|nr:pentapeptide repeat-containing protein [Syntrophales bacterium]